MKFRNPETGEIFDTIIEALERYCQDHPQELLILMGYEVVEKMREEMRGPQLNAGDKEEANMDKPLNDWTLGEVLEACKTYTAQEECNPCPFLGKNGVCRFRYSPTDVWNLENGFTEQEVEDAKTIKRMFGADNFTHIRKDQFGLCEMMDGPGDDPNVGWCAIGMEEGMFPSLRPNETVTLDEIIGGADHA